MNARLALGVAALTVACGGKTGLELGSTGPSSATGGSTSGVAGSAGARAGGSGAAGASGGAGGAPSGAAGSGGGGPVCSALTVSICDGPCPSTCPGTCLPSQVWPEGNFGLGFCPYGEAWTEKGHSCPLCEDGMVCVGGWRCGPREMCELFELNGQFNSCTYSDFTPLDDAPIPEPEVCPVLPGASVKLCGGACGGCGAEEGCVLRSPTHPVGLCLPLLLDTGKPEPPVACGIGSGCKIGTACYIPMGPLAYMKANQELNLCFPLDTCKALANDLPGGGVCETAKGLVLAGQWPTE